MEDLEQINKKETQEFERPNSLQLRIAEIFKKEYPKAYQRTVEEMDQLKQELEEREQIVDEMDIEEAVKAYGYSTENIEKIEGSKVVISVENHFMEDRLPKEYGYSGGAARALLLRNLKVNHSAEPRDIDLIRFSISDEDLEDNPELAKKDAQLARKYMPKDFEDGYGPKEFEGEKEYLNTRDLTINQVYATDEQVVATEQCIKDNIRHILRVTEYEKEEFGGVSPKMQSKMIRFYAKRIEKYNKAELADLEDQKLEEYFIKPFWLAVQLDRAYEESEKYALKYIEKLKKHDQIPSDVDTIQEAAEHLLDLMRDNFYFRCIDLSEEDKDQFELEEKWKDYEKLPSHQGMGKR